MYFTSFLKESSPKPDKPVKCTCENDIKDLKKKIDDLTEVFHTKNKCFTYINFYYNKLKLMIIIIIIVIGKLETERNYSENKS